MIDYKRHHADKLQTNYDSYYKCEKHDAEGYRQEKLQAAAKKAEEEAAAAVAKISHHEHMKKLNSTKKIQPNVRGWLSRRRTKRKRDAVDKEKRRISVENVVEGNNARIFGRRPSKDAEESRELAKSIGKRVQNKNKQRESKSNEVPENVLDDALTAFEQDGGRKKKLRNRKNRKTAKT